MRIGQNPTDQIYVGLQSGTAETGLSFDVVDEADAFAATLDGSNGLVLAATESPDALAASAVVEIASSLAAMEAPDQFAGSADSGQVFIPVAPSGGGRFVPPPVPRIVHDMRLHAREAPDVCMMTMTVDWSEDDEDIELLMMEAA